MLAVLTKWQLTAPVGGSEGTQQLLHGNNSPGATDAEWHCMVVGSCILGKVCSSNSDCGEQWCVDHASIALNCMDEQQGGAPVVPVADTAAAPAVAPAAVPSEATSQQGNNSPGATDAEWRCCYMMAGSCTLGKVCSSSSDCGGQLCVDRAHCIDEQQGGDKDEQGGDIDEQQSVVPVADTAAAPAAPPAAAPAAVRTRPVLKDERRT